MERFIRQMWWKYIAVALLLASVAGGLLLPLGAGIIRLEPYLIKEQGVVRASVLGYHTHFEAADTRIWLRDRGTYYCIDSFKTLNQQELTLFLNTQQLPSGLRALDVVINNRIDGTIALREAVLLKTGTPDSNSYISCEPSVENNRASGISFPYREILYESIRNLFFHVPMWFGMLLLLLVSFVQSLRFLRTGKLSHDLMAASFVRAGLLFGVLGLLTGMVWANFTWGEPWPNDPKLNGAAMGVLIYFAYSILRGAIPDEIRRARLSAVYNLFAFVVFVIFIFIIPRLTDSLHPGNGGNPAFVKYDLDNTLRIFFYPAVIGWAGIGCWIAGLMARISSLENQKN
jgi:heme exporter protein C